ncbi:class IV adenylate cyclase [Methanobacterium petrolearium]|uniref:class IV adenylate cyclase n=1 Tax=Methanobacterium petrolearium TaxID=710190 RepID=UPI001AE30A75|nr:class IV adenylate cyclase [Methanobacterium petrolearium]MBP1946892.1 adenylate cyclase class 2 [Methanobacterium petrolearium]BDZ70508.1 adenylate cyclase [Methanobacterium petrolearium]
MIEVEVKAHAPNLNKIEERLIGIGACRVKKEYQEDLYFNAPHRDFAQTDEALRIRKIRSENSEEIYITYKGPKMDNISKTRKEIEVAVEDSLKVADIFENLSFRPVATVRKNRIIYTMGELMVALDEVQEVGSFVEIEKEIEEGEDTQEALNEIFATYSKIGINDGFERTSYLELMETD